MLARVFGTFALLLGANVAFGATCELADDAEVVRGTGRVADWAYVPGLSCNFDELEALCATLGDQFRVPGQQLFRFDSPPVVSEGQFWIHFFQGTQVMTVVLNEGRVQRGVLEDPETTRLEPLCAKWDPIIHP